MNLSPRAKSHKRRSPIVTPADRSRFAAALMRSPCFTDDVHRAHLWIINDTLRRFRAGASPVGETRPPPSVPSSRLIHNVLAREPGTANGELTNAVWEAARPAVESALTWLSARYPVMAKYAPGVTEAEWTAVCRSILNDGSVSRVDAFLNTEFNVHRVHAEVWRIHRKAPATRTPWSVHLRDLTLTSIQLIDDGTRDPTKAGGGASIEDQVVILTPTPGGTLREAIKALRMVWPAARLPDPRQPRRAHAGRQAIAIRHIRLHRAYCRWCGRGSPGGKPAFYRYILTLDGRWAVVWPRGATPSTVATVRAALKKACGWLDPVPGPPDPEPVVSVPPEPEPSFPDPVEAENRRSRRWGRGKTRG